MIVSTTSIKNNPWKEMDWVPVEDHQKEIEQWEMARKAWETQIGYLKQDITTYEAKIEAANKKLAEKVLSWETAYSMEANDLQWSAINDLQDIQVILHIPRKELQESTT